jgi:anti-anti-sigma factor
LPPEASIGVEPLSSEATIVTLRGEHDLASRPLIADALREAGSRGSVLVDLSHATFVDASVVHALLAAGNTLIGRGLRFELVVPRRARAVRRVLEILGLTSLLRMHPTRAAGAASVAAAVMSGPAPGVQRLRAIVQPVDPSALERETWRQVA